MSRTLEFSLVSMGTIVIFSLQGGTAHKVEVIRFVNTGKQIMYCFIIDLKIEDTSS